MTDAELDALLETLSAHSSGYARDAHSALSALRGERDAWKAQHDAVLSQARKDNLRAEDADRYEQWLLDLGRISGCGHVDENLPRCIEQAFEAMRDERGAALTQARGETEA